MKLCILIITLLAISFSFGLSHREIIETVNSNPFVKWKAGKNKFTSWTDDMIKKRLLGAIITPTKYSNIRFTRHQPKGVPSSFDSRTHWKGCIHPIRNQKHCGSCWAFAGSEVLSDRFCIKSNKTVDVILSPQDLVSCDPSDQGCNGGRLGSEWSYMVKHGVVPDTCLPYVSGDGHVPACPKTCVDGKTPLKQVKHYAKNYEHVGGFLPFHRENKIMKELSTNGPVEGAFLVYKDFMSYKSGVYHHTTGGFLGGHAIKVVGYGNQDGTPYWIVANSWGPTWGLDGFFWIKRGNNECELESQIYAGEPKL